jgi:hypothetical protein
MVSNPTLADTVGTWRAHGLPMPSRELAEATPYGPNVDEGDGCDAIYEKKLS